MYIWVPSLFCWLNAVSKIDVFFSPGNVLVPPASCRKVVEVDGQLINAGLPNFLS